MSNYFIVIKSCLVKPLDLSLSVSDVIPTPQLHCHIGVGNWGWDWVKTALGESRYEELFQWFRQRGLLQQRAIP